MEWQTQEFDIILLGGQSNAEGSGVGPVERELQQREDVLYLNAEKQVEHTPERVVITYKDVPFSIEVAKENLVDNEKVGNFTLTFARSYIESGLLKKGRKILIIRAAIGGTGFQKGNWGLTDSVYLKMLEMTDYALSLNKNNKVVAFLWHQGEHDAFEGNAPDNYKKQLTNMVSDVRLRYGKMPFIAGDFVQDWKGKNAEICAPIINTIRQVVDENECSAFVETIGLPSNDQKIGNGDDIHFCRESLHELGQRYFAAFQKIKS